MIKPKIVPISSSLLCSSNMFSIELVVVESLWSVVERN
jgi:hypothetical protein